MPHIVDGWNPPPPSPSYDKFPRFSLAIPTREEVDQEEEVTAGWEIPDPNKELPGSGWSDDHDQATSG
ncbi:hypothetical protein KI387_018483, partial [Taxus chinensis]